LGLRYLIAPAATGLSMAWLRDWLGWNREFFQGHPSVGIWVFVFAIVQIFFWLVLIRWLSGRLLPQPKS
jgi:cytochrome b561